MQVSTNKFYHIAIAFRLFRMAVESHWEDIVKPNLTEAITKEEFLSRIASLEARGFEVLPPCNHHDKQGHCLGHINK